MKEKIKYYDNGNETMKIIQAHLNNNLITIE